MVKRKSVGTVNKEMYPAGSASFDWATTNCIAPVKDQEYFCHNCWAFSSIASLEAHWCIKTGQAVSLLEQQAVDCNRNLQTGNWGCDGGSSTSYHQEQIAHLEVTVVNIREKTELQQHMFIGVYVRLMMIC